MADGPPYLHLLERVQHHVVPRTYVEIGVATGRTINFALPCTAAVGIDPAPDVQFPLGNHVQIFAETSDDFFAQHDLREVLGGRPVDLAFIDGMHHFEFALRDFINVERFATPEATVLLHDCYPIDERTAERDRSTDLWSGDVWRLVRCLQEWRPDLQLSTVDTAPTGMGLIRHLDPSSTVLTEHYDEIVAQYLALPFSTLEGRQAQLLNRVPDEWPVVKALLPAQPLQHYNVASYRVRRSLHRAAGAGRRRLLAAKGASAPRTPSS